MASNLPVALSVPVQFQDPGPLTSQQLNANFLQLVELLEQTNAAVNTLQNSALNVGFATAFSPLIQNYGNYVGAAGGSSATNMAALTAMFAAMPNGGYAWIPQASFPVTSGASPGSITVPCNSIVQALGTGGKAFHSLADFYHFVISEGVANGVFLDLTTQNHSYGGIELRNIAFNWVSPSQYATAVNLNIISGLVYGCTFNNCPTAVAMNGLQNLVERCNVNITNAGQANATWFLLASEQGKIVGPSEFLQSGQSQGGPAGNVAIAVGGGISNAENMVIERLHLANPSIGIGFADTNSAMSNAGFSRSGCTHLIIDKVHCQANATAINLTPSSTSNNAYIINTKISNCTFLKGQGSANASPLVLLDGGTVVGNTVYGVEMVNCDVLGNVTSSGTPEANQYGVQISNLIDGVLIDNCRISQFGTPAGSDGTANIAVLGNPGPGSINISNCDLRPIYNALTVTNAQPFGSSSNGSTASQYAFLIPASATLSNCKIRINNCNMNGFVGSPVHVAGTISGSATLKIYNCSGYNDAATVVTSTQPVIGAAGATSAAAQGYYGPSVFSGVNTGSNTTLTWASKTYTLLANQVFSFTVDPYDSMSLSQSITTFRWIGV